MSIAVVVLDSNSHSDSYHVGNVSLFFDRYTSFRWLRMRTYISEPSVLKLIIVICWMEDK